MNNQDTGFYRNLEVVEIIQEGDEWSEHKGWTKATLLGGRFSLEPGMCRRPIKPPAPHRPEGLPETIPDPPSPPEGMKWEYRGMGWDNREAISINWHEKWSPKEPWAEAPAVGGKSFHYCEAVPIDFNKCKWPGCANKALCASGNFGNKLVCRDHFMITNGTPDPDDDSPIGACNCLTKTPTISFHKKGCKYRLIMERDEANRKLNQILKIVIAP